MSNGTEFCAVILAAGASSRMGRDKALLPWPPANSSGSTLLSAAILALQPFAKTVIVVAAENADRLAPTVAAASALLERNPAPERGQFSSMQIGLRAALDHGCGAAIITPVDCPPLSKASLEKLCAAFEEGQTRGAFAIAPEHDGHHGHPLLAGHDLIEALLSAPVTSNAREVNQAHAAKIEYLPVPDALLAADINTPEEYAAMAKSGS